VNQYIYFRIEILISGFGNNGKVIFFLSLILASIIGLLLAPSIAIIQLVYATSGITTQVFAQDSAGNEHKLNLRATE
jgi:hypothetical protein